MDAIWYYLAEGQEQGPVTLDELVRALLAAPHPQQEYIWQEGMEEWQTAGSVPEVRRQLQVHRPAPPEPSAIESSMAPPLPTPAPPSFPSLGQERPLPLDDAEAIAKLYRRLVILVGSQLLLGCFLQVPAAIPQGQPGTEAVSLLLGALLLFALLFATVATVVSTYRLARYLEAGPPILWVVAMFLPCISVFTLLLLSSKAQVWCRQRGIRVGLFGPTRESIEELRRGRWTSEFD